MSDRPTPETDAFYLTFADGLACPSQEEWLDRLKRYERQRDELLEALDECLLAWNEGYRTHEVPEAKKAHALIARVKGGSHE
jgi:hypothetical protein